MEEQTTFQVTCPGCGNGIEVDEDFLQLDSDDSDPVHCESCGKDWEWEFDEDADPKLKLTVEAEFEEEVEGDIVDPDGEETEEEGDEEDEG